MNSVLINKEGRPHTTIQALLSTFCLIPPLRSSEITSPAIALLRIYGNLNSRNLSGKPRPSKLYLQSATLCSIWDWSLRGDSLINNFGIINIIYEDFFPLAFPMRRYDHYRFGSYFGSDFLAKFLNFTVGWV